MWRDDRSSSWPPLPYPSWRDSCATLHLWPQIVGKICLAQSSWINHSWHVTLQVTARGLGTRLLGHGSDSFQHFSATLREFVLPYEDMRTSASPDQALLEFLQSTYEAAANLGAWDRKALERDATPGERQ